MTNNKIKITQKEFNEIYQIDTEYQKDNNYKEITGETEEPIPDKQDTTPFLTEEEQIQNDEYLKDYPVEPIEDENLA